MTFFPAEPEPSEADELVPQRQPWWGPPDDDLPVLLSATEILATTEHVSVALVGVFVHRDGVELRVERRLRRRQLSRREWQELLGRFAEHGMLGEPSEPAERLRFGLVLGDGKRVFDGRPFDPGTDPGAMREHHTLMRNGGSGGGDERFYTGNERLWLWPLPPEGPIELVMQWPALGIDETHAVLDGTRIRQLAEEVVPLWPAD